METQYLIEEVASNIISPESKGPAHKLFSSPIQVAEFSDQNKNETSSPDIFIEFTNSFKKIIEKQNEQESQNEELVDIMGNKICQFDTKIYDEYEKQNQSSPISDDKQNDLPKNYLQTPLKISKKETRSPLLDITPSMTQKKKKTNSKIAASQKAYFLTPRTMEKSTLNSGSALRRIQRF